MELDGDGAGLGFPIWAASRRRFKPDDPFFASGNMERELLAKQVALDLTEDERYQLQNLEVVGANTVFCPIAGCGAQLDCLEDFEDHYNTRHTASCSVCSRVYPTSRLLSIHVSEAHDSFFQAKVARGFPMYECLVEGCGVKLKSYKSRQQHLMDKHSFPPSFEFYKKARPSKNQRQKNQRKQATYRREEKMETHMDADRKALKQMHQKYQPKKLDHQETKETEMEVEEKIDDHQKYEPKKSDHQERKETEMDVEEKVDDLASAVSKLSTSESSPSSISFGHRHTRGFAFVPRSIQQNRKQTSQREIHE